MKRHFVRVLALAIIALLTGENLVAQAQGQRSPSVRAAARLKNHPPAGWIRHYLPDDRYKILGGTWKFVSTELDRFYYPAWAPEMLRQRASRVIGFASAEDAQEAGYLPGGGYANVDPGFDRTNATRTVAVQSSHVVNRGRRSIRVTLSDGASTVAIPPGWEYLKLPSSTLQTAQGAMLDYNDMVRPISKRGGYTIFNIQTMPAGVNAEESLAQQSQMVNMFGNLLRRAERSSGTINSQVNTVTTNLKSNAFRMAGLRGFRINAPGQAIMAGTQVFPVDSLGIVARRNKFYMLGLRGKGGAGSSGVISSFQAR